MCSRLGPPGFSLTHRRFRKRSCGVRHPGPTSFDGRVAWRRALKKGNPTWLAAGKSWKNHRKTMKHMGTSLIKVRFIAGNVNELNDRFSSWPRLTAGGFCFLIVLELELLQPISTPSEPAWACGSSELSG